LTFNRGKSRRPLNLVGEPDRLWRGPGFVGYATAPRSVSTAALEGRGADSSSEPHCLADVLVEHSSSKGQVSDRQTSGRLGHRCVLASVYPHDVRIASKDFIVRDVLKRTRCGSIIVLHEGTPERTRVAETLDEVLRALRRRRYEIVAASELLAEAQTDETAHTSKERGLVGTAVCERQGCCQN
jgi:hypothetical protein